MLVFGSALEWLIAAAFLLATVGVATLIVRELCTAPPRAGAAPAPGGSEPAGRRARASCVGADPAAGGQSDRPDSRGGPHVSRELGSGWRSGRGGSWPTAARSASVSRGVYEHNGTRFVPRFEPFERNGELRVAGIYLQ